MMKLLLVAVAGFIAQLIDGSLGMAFGVTATTGLLAVGAAPAVASASVHLAELGTSVSSGISHWRLGNVDWPVVIWLALPGAVGGFLGATVLSSLSTEAAEPWMAVILIVLGSYVLARFSLGRTPLKSPGLSPKGRRWLMPLGAFAGFIDATGGGGWGPISTSTLLSSGRLSPRRTIGSVDTSELLVSLGASAGFLTSLGGKSLSGTVIVGLLIGGVIAAPLAAYLVRVLPTRVIGVGAGGLIVVTNLSAVLDAFGVPTVVQWTVTGVVVSLWLVAVIWIIRATVAEGRAARAAVADPEPAGV